MPGVCAVAAGEFIGAASVVASAPDPVLMRMSGFFGDSAGGASTGLDGSLRASFQSRATLCGEIFKTWPVSSTVRPPK